MASMAEETNITAEVVKNLPAIIAALTGMLTALGIILIGYWTYQGNKQRAENGATLTAQTATLATQSTVLKEVATQVDGITSKLVDATAGKNRAEGELAGRDTELARQSETAPASAEPHPIHTSENPLAVKLVTDAEAVKGPEKP